LSATVQRARVAHRATTIVRVRSFSGPAAWLAAGACAFATIVILHPGQYPFDAAYQLWQARSGEFANGSPVAMIAVWSLLLEGGASPAMLFCLNLAMFWAGLALCTVVIVDHLLARVVLMLVLGMAPLALVEMAHVLTDAHLAAVLVLATGLAAWGLTACTRAAVAACAALLVYAGCVRHNALLAILPYGALAGLAFAGTRTRTRTAALAGVAVVGIASLAAGLALDRALVRQRVVVWPTLALWDLAAISVDRNVLLLPPFTHGPGMTVNELRKTGAFDMTSNTLLFEKSRSGIRDATIEPYSERQLRELRAAWIEAVLRNPGAYVRHRLRTFGLLIGPHRGETRQLAYFVSRAQYGDNPPLPAPLAPRMQDTFYRLAAALAPTWLFAALPYLLLSVLASIVAWPRRDRPAARLALAISTGALLYAAGYVPLAPAADLRYLTWPIVAGPLALAFALSALATKRRRPMEAWP
jgi:hypothetical protein